MPAKEILNKKSNLTITKNSWPILIVVVIIIILAAGYFLIIAPAINKWQENKNLIVTQQDNLIVKNKTLEELQSLINLYQKVEPSLQKRLPVFLPTAEDLPNLHYTLDNITKQAGYKILAINVDTKQPGATSANAADNATKNTKASLKEIKVRIKLNGTSYVNLKSLLLALEKNLRLFNLETFDYNPEESQVEINLKTYYYN